LLSETDHILGKDSTLDPHQQPGGRSHGGGNGGGRYRMDSSAGAPSGYDQRKDENMTTAQRRCHHNLRHSELNTVNPLPSSGDHQTPPPAPTDEDPTYVDRRRGEKNFSDLFGVQMGEREQVRGNRVEVIGSHTCSFLDPRSEIAVRNKDKWVHHDEVTANDRKEAEVTSHLFEFARPGKQPVDGIMQQHYDNERTCYDTKDIMQSGSEIARRHRMKDQHNHADDGQTTAFDRKQNGLSSSQIRGGFGAPGQPQSSGPGNAFLSPRSQQKGGYPSHGSGGGYRVASAKQTKIASLQSSMLGA